MIKRLSGQIVDIGHTYIVLEVNGVGYHIYTTQPQNHQLEAGVTFYTHLAVRENALDLYGFTDRDTLELFEMLIDLPKVGPKTALQFLTQADVELIKASVIQNNPTHLHKLSGIGKKSAEKIVLGLKDKFDNTTYISPTDKTNASTQSTHYTDTIDALVALGYNPQDARQIVIEITTTNPTLDSSAEIIKLALRQIN